MEQNRQTGQSQRQSKGLGVDLGVLELNVELSINGLQTLSDTLNSALNKTGDALSQGVNQVVNTVRQLGIDKIKNWLSQGGEEQRGAYNQLVSKLQEAAQRGEDEARNLLNSLGENVSGAGQKMQDVASKEGRSH